MLTRKRYLIIIFVSCFFAFVMTILSPFFGSESITLNKVIEGCLSGFSTTDSEIFILHRLPRGLMAFFVGGALAVCGSALQVTLRNPLAEPYILGMAGGGTVGAVAAITFPKILIQWGVFSTLQIFSLTGCSICLFCIYQIAKNTTGLSLTVVLLAGVTINTVCAAIILLMRYLADPHMLVAMDRWMMGGLDVVGYSELMGILPLLIAGMLIIFSCAKSLDILSLGDEFAMGRGVDVGRIHKWIFVGSGLATAAAVSFAGPIGFVGLIIPHGVRYFTGFDHRLILPLAFFAGGVFLTICDTFARTAMSPTEMPVGIITAIVGGPLFIYILLKGKWR